MQQGDVVFCEGWKLEEFFQGPALKISRPFVLVSSNGDTNINEGLVAQKPPVVHRWFAQNVRVRAAGLDPIPLGLENRVLHWHGKVGDFHSLRRRHPAQKTRVLYGFTIETNPEERTEALKALRQTPLAEPLTGRLNSRLYREQLAQYRFVASPEGNGLDCHRTWEAMYLGVVPIVRRSVAMDEFAALGMPLLVIDQWDDLRGWDEARWNFLYRERMGLFTQESLFFDFWAARIRMASAVCKE